jgi:hypothetical protein
MIERRGIPMKTYQSILDDLAARARAGDPGALDQLRDRLADDLTVLVRRELRCGAGPSPFGDRVRATAGHLARYAADQRPDQERLVRRVTSCLLESLCDGLARGPSRSQRMRETVRV